MVKFKIEYVKLAEELDGNKEELPTDFVMYFKDRKTRSELASPGEGNVVIITNSQNYDTYTLIDLPSKKIAIEQKGSDQKVERDSFDKSMTVTETTETKVICGLTCKKAIVNYTEDGKKATTTVYYTTEITPANNDTYSKINGFLMEFEKIDENGSTVKLIAQELIKQTVSDDKFIIPAGYTKVSEEDLIDLIGDE